MTLTLLALALVCDAARGGQAARPVYDYAALAEQRLASLECKRAVFRVRVVVFGTPDDGFVWCICASNDAVVRCAKFPNLKLFANVTTVEATVRRLPRDGFTVYFLDEIVPHDPPSGKTP